MTAPAIYARAAERGVMNGIQPAVACVHAWTQWKQIGDDVYTRECAKCGGGEAARSGEAAKVSPDPLANSLTCAQSLRPVAETSIEPWTRLITLDDEA